MVKKLPPLRPAPRSFSWRTYSVAFVFSAFLFLAGIFVGLQLSSQVSAQFAQQAEELRSNTRELEVLLLLVSSASGGGTRFCSALLEQARALDERTTDFGLRLDALEKSRGRLDAGVQSLKRDYSIMQVRDYLVFEQISRACNQPLSQIVFFYSNEGCPACSEQGAVLRELKRANPAVLVYALDVDIGTPITRALTQALEINSYPAMLVDGRVVSGLKNQQELLALLAGKQAS